MSILYEQVFSKSPEKAIVAAKKKSKIECWLYDEARTRLVEGETLYVGTKIQVNAALYDVTDPARPTPLTGKTIKIYHRLNTGAWEVIFSGTPNAPELAPHWYKVIYTLAQAGSHTFYAEFPGDAEYEGCQKAVRAFAKYTVC